MPGRAFGVESPRYRCALNTREEPGPGVIEKLRLPAFAAVTDDPRADEEILNHEVFVAFEGRSEGRVGQRDDDLVGNGQLGGLEPLG